MIRLNDINNTVIDERSINEYYSQDELSLNVIKLIICGIYETVTYSTKEARDKDIELLDKFFEVKPLELEYNPKKNNPKIQTSIYDFDLNGEKESNGE
jgi:hypothetical protein